MRRYTALCLLALLLPLLSGCGGSIYSNYREIEQLQLIQTIGLDLEGGVTVSVSTGSGLGGSKPVRLSRAASSIASAMESLQSYTAEEVLFYAHTKYALLGEDAASAGIGGYLDYFERSTQIRPETAVLTVMNGTAKELVTEAGGAESDITEVLSSLSRDVEKNGDSYLFTVREIARSLAENGAALTCAVRVTDIAGSEFSGGGSAEGVTALPAGYAVLTHGHLVSFIGEDISRGVNLLMGKPGTGSVVLPGDGEPVTLELDGGEISAEGVWEGDRLTGVHVTGELKASLVELSRPQVVTDARFLSMLEEQLAAEAESWILSVLNLSGELGADFLGLGKTLRRDEPRRFDGLSDWRETLPKLDFTAELTTMVERSYGIGDPPAAAEEAK